MNRTIKQAPPLVLVDGSSYLFRAFHALPPLVTSRGQPTGAVKGVINMIRALMKAYPDSPLAIVFDAKGSTFRNRIYTEYKAHRPPMPDELRSQIKPIHDIVRAMGLPLLIIDDVEADDVIGTLANQAAKAGVNTLISTGDKDLAQLVNEHVTLMNTMTNETLDRDGVIRKFGIPPERIIDFLALTGDKSDNIPGVPGVGPKTAVKWLEDYGSMEGIIEHAGEIKGKIGERLRENLDALRLSYELATIRQNVGMDVGIDGLEKTAPDQPELLRLFSELEFKSWIAELQAQGVESAADPAGTASAEDSAAAAEAPDVNPATTDYALITDESGLERLLKTLRDAGRFALYIEHDGAHPMHARITGIAVSCKVGEGYYLPVAHAGDSVVNQDLQSLKVLLEDPNIVKIAFDLKTVCHVLQNHGIQLKPHKSDTLLASYVLNSVAIKHQLEDMARHYLDMTVDDIETLVGKGRKRLEFAELEPALAAPFVAQRADLILRLDGLLTHRLRQSGNLFGLYTYYEMPLVPVLQKMERRGVKLDASVLQQQSDELGKRLQELEQSVYAAAGEEFNLGSPKQLQAIFYDKLQLPILKKTKTGQPSTAEPILQELARQYELPKLIMEHRGLSKLKSTYTDKLPLEINPETGRIHSNYQQAVAATGRLSSTEPNLQNIPIRTAEGRRVRQAFISEPGYKLLAADYSQVELRIMAHLSQDAGLVKAFADGLDVHRATAAEVFGVALDDVSPDQRRSAKAINFGLIYGMSAFGLANQLGIERRDAQKYVDRYFERYPGVRRFMDQTRALADEQGYVETLFGRRLYLPDIRAGNAQLRQAAQRTAINAPMQGTAADIIKHAMIDIDHWLDLGDLDARMLMQVHDELIFEVADRDVELLAEGVRFRMISAAAMDVPLVVDVGVGSNWDQAH
ncbi:MAG: hypothetical protein RLZZ385_720 [Pseudomonadota bacterium]|jgi:DNA polymerase-1